MNAPRVTEQSIKDKIVNVKFFNLPDTTVTICHITLRTGYSVRGESACVSPENFDRVIGENIAYENAFHKLWALEGYLLAEKVHEVNGDPLDRIASLCHNVNRAYCQAMGDYSQPAWDDAPEWQKASARMGVDMHLMGDFGPEASHLGWMNQKIRDGWVYGPEKDAEKKTHPCMVPFDKLPVAQQAKDFIFQAIVHSFKNPKGE